MTPFLLARLLPAALVVAAVAGCDRAPRNQAKAPVAPRVEAGAVTTAMPAPETTVALSGAVRDLPPTTTPDSTAGKPVTPMPTPSAAVRPPPVVDTRPRTAPPGETAAMRQFREAQARRDRELLERDMDDARSPTRAPRDEVAVERDGLADDARYDPRDDAAALEDEPPVDEDLPPIDDELPADEDLPADDELPADEDVPPEDEDLRWDPDTGTWR